MGFSDKLCQQTVSKLIDLIAHLQFNVNVEGKSRLELLKLIRTAVDDAVVDPGDIDLDICLRDALALLTSSAPPLEKTTEETNLTKLEMTLLALKLEQQKELAAVLKELEDEKHRLNGGNPPSSLDKGDIPNPPSGDVPKKPAAAPLSTVTSILQREFKISGQIGEPGQYDKLTYVSLIHQIESGLAKGYSHKDIADAVIQSISPHSSLRNYVP